MTSASSPSPSLSLPRTLLCGLIAGSVAAAAAVLVSLPLKSPDDVFFNSATVAFGALAAGLGAGTVWWAAQRRSAPLLHHGLAVVAAFIVVAAGALLMDALPDAPLERVARFVVPLAGIVFGVVGVLTPLIARLSLPAQWIAPAGAAAAVVLGVVLAGQGDAESGRLELPALAGGADVGQQPAGGASVLRPADVAGAVFVITSGESAATYTVREKLAQFPLPNDAVGRTNQITGTVHLDGRPSTITVDLRTLESDQPRRDNFIRTMGGPMFNRYPLAEFTVNELPPLPAEYRPGETFTGKVTGTMKIREVERPTTFDVEARLQDGVLQVLGRTSFTWNDFQIPPPNVGGIVQVEDTVKVEVLLVARRG